MSAGASHNIKAFLVVGVHLVAIIGICTPNQVEPIDALAMDKPAFAR